MRKSHLNSLIQKWLRLATRRGIEELSLNCCRKNQYWRMLDDYGTYAIPQFIFDSSSLTKLCTILCDYAPKGEVCWRSLRVLTIEPAELSNDGLQRILLGSPMLEYMELHRCSGSMSSIDISSHGRLAKLVLEEIQDPENDELNVVIEILCPNLKLLELSGTWYQKIWRLLDVSALLDVCLTFEVEVSQFDFIDFSMQLLEKIKHVKKITLGTWCVQVLSLLEFRGLSSPLSGSVCECLSLNTEFNKWCPFGLAHLLHWFPTVQKLVIDMTIISNVEESPDMVFPQNYQERAGRTFICLLEHLKTIEITGLRPFHPEPDDLEMVGFLLRNARVLKEMVIHFECKFSEFSCNEKAEPFLCDSKKLLSFPRCSPRAVVLVR